MKLEPMVSVWMTSYNHEPYIRQAIDSILAQKTDYPYEIVIGDDCSQDATRSILEEYRRQYPEVIRLLLNEHNLGITENVYNVKCSCRGKYIVNLSGDDYWIDENKIQKQTDFLEAHPEYVAACCTVAVRRNFDEVNLNLHPEKKYRGGEYTLEMFQKGILMPEHGMMMRNVFATERGREHFTAMKKFSRDIDDLADPVLILEEGRVYLMPDVMAVYRVISSGQRAGKSNFNSKYTYVQKFDQIVEMNNAIHEYLPDEVDISRRYDPYVSLGIMDSLRRHSFRDFKEVYAKIPDEYRKKGMMARALFGIPKLGAKKVYGKIIKPIIKK